MFDGTEREPKDPEPEGSESVSATEWGYGVPAAHMHGRVHQCRAMWPGTQQKQGSLQKVLYMQKPSTPDTPLCYLWKKGTGRLLQLQEDVATPPPTFVHLWSTWSLQSSSMQVHIVSSLSTSQFLLRNKSSSQSNLLLLLDHDLDELTLSEYTPSQMSPWEPRPNSPGLLDSIAFKSNQDTL